jgi:hypothetical protein
MADLDTRPGPREYLCSLRQHVREPITSALEHVQRERREVTRECEAFEAFADRVAEFSTTAAKSQPAPVTTDFSSRQTTEADSLREAYRETVMAVSHYERVYDEPLVANVRAELGAEIATLFESTGDTALIPAQQQAVVSAAKQAATDREEFCDALETEEAALESLLADLTAVLDELNSTVVPAWYRQTFREKLTAIITTRQSQLAERSFSYLNGHNLCESLYSDQPQTYPVLMAVARLHDCVEIRE